MDLADRLAERWYEESQEQGLPTDSYHPLKAGLRAFLPVDAPAGIAYRDEHPFVLALAPEALLFFAPPAVDQLLDAFALPIASIRVLAVSSGHVSTPRTNYRLCTWTLREADGSPCVHQTRRVIGNGFDSDNGGEAVMLGLSQRLGWPTPLYQKEGK
ncbi:MAG TPA: hypothetical protein VNO20_02790 [Solirubrobacterales bacterium]|nr:hypothetical protein [Solirubrobacterales bacterium]